MLKKTDLIIDLSNIDRDDKDVLGEKAASLGEMKKQGFPFPDGFVVTSNAFHLFLKHDPERLANEIFRAYKRLDNPLNNATVEILLSFPPNSNHQTIKKKEVVKGEAVLLQKIKSIFSALLTSSNSLNINPSIVVQKIPQSVLSGTLLTTDPTDKAKIIIKDKFDYRYKISKKDLKTISENINKSKKQLLSDKKLNELANLGKKIQKYYYFPQEVNFVIDKSKIYVTSVEPITILTHHASDRSSIKLKHNILLKGKPLYSGIAIGHLRKIQNIQDVSTILRGDIVVVPYHDLIGHSFVKAGGIVATDNSPLRNNHIPLGRFFSGKPTILTTSDASKMLTNGTVVTVNGKNGEVYLG